MSGPSGTEPYSGAVAAETEKKKSCRYCGSEMSLAATLCPTCKSYQNRFRNVATYLAGIAGFLALIVSATAFTVGKVNDMISDRSWQDRVAIGYLQYPGHPANDHNGETLIFNTGDGDIFVVDIIMQFNKGNMAIPIGAMVGKKSFARVVLRQFDTPMIANPPDDSVWLANSSGFVSDETISEAFSGRPDRCVFLRFLSRTHPDFRRMNEFYKPDQKKLATISVRSFLNVFSLHTGEPFVVPVAEAVGAFVIKISSGCARDDWFKDGASADAG